MGIETFHPAVREWFEAAIGKPTSCQERAWAAHKAGRHVLVAAPTGSGKTLAAFLAAIDDLVREGEVFGLPDETRIVYVSPLRALSNDIQKNLQIPLEGIERNLFATGNTRLVIRSRVRTGDTPVAERATMLRMPPHILVTTPESIYILLTSASGRRMLRSVRTVIVDEIHAVLGSKRGSHLALSLERLQRLAGRPILRIGLSATQSPVEEVARFLIGVAGDCCIIDEGYRRRLDFDIELPDVPLQSVLSQEAASQVYDRMAALIEAHRTTLVFVNTRRMAERLARALSERLGEERVTSHHGSLAKEQRLAAEQRLKSGELKALVATASLELGIDVGLVDLVLQFGATASIAALLQRVGRSGHFAGGVPKGRLFPTSRDDLIDCIALVDAIQRGELDRTCILRQPLDVLAQQIVAMVACEEWQEEELYRLVRAAYPYRDLERRTFTEVIRMLAEGYSTRRGVRGAYLHWDRIHGRLRARRGASLTAITCGGAIPDTAEYRVIVEPSGEVVGSVDEDFAIESLSGDIFQLGNSSWRILRLDGGALRVEDAQHAPPSIPFWFGEAPGRSHELSAAVSRFRCEVGRRIEREDPAQVAAAWAEKLGIATLAAEQAVSYLFAAKMALGNLPTHDTVVFERFFDESGGMHFIIHAPFGSRVNRAWGLALRKRFCRTFNFELQAAATENALLLSFGVAQSFALEEVKEFLSPATVREVLIQALLDAPMFKIRWRWNVVCSLALRRFQGGRKTPPYLLRMQAEDLVTCVFPEQLACLENIVGDRHVPDHPLVQQTIEDCLTEAMDLERLVAILQGVREGRIRVVCRDVTEPSPLGAEIVNARVYSFLDGAPLEERRTRAVAMRRWLDPATAGDLGRLDQAAIARVVDEVRPRFETVEELHDALYSGGYLTGVEVTAGGGAEFARRLAETRRAVRLPWGLCGGIWIAAERWPQFRVLGGDELGIELSLPAELNSQQWEAEEALARILGARLEISGPVTVAELKRQLGLDEESLETALLRLEREGFVLRGSFRDEVGELEWCQRHLLACIHRHTIHRLRAEIEPVTTRDFLRYLLLWQYVHPDTRVRGKEGLALVLEQLEGYQAPVATWERDILPARVADYDPAWLDMLCLGGRFLWRRIPRDGAGGGPVRSVSIALLPRARIPLWTPPHAEVRLSSAAAKVVEQLERRGALFFDELITTTGLLRAQVEDALAELAGKGVVNCDSFQGLRSLLLPETHKRRFRKSYGIEEAGRWNALPRFDHGAAGHPDRVGFGEQVARVLLRRYGVLFRALLERETLAPSWLELVAVLRRLGARGEVRGGRFVAGRYGEQFALPEAVEMLRGVRNRARAEEEPIALSSADPLNLLGIVTPGEKISALSGRLILFRDGIPEVFGKMPRKIAERAFGAGRGTALSSLPGSRRGERR